MSDINLVELKCIMLRRNISKKALQKMLGMSNTTLYRKTHGLSDWRRSEIQAVCDALTLSGEEVRKIFYPDT